MSESKEELKSLLMNEKVGLKLSSQKTKIMASGPSWQIEGGKVEAMTNLIFLGSSITADSDCSQEIRRYLLLGRKAMRNQKQRYTLQTKVCQSYTFSSSHVCIWELNHKESWVLKNWCFWTVVLEKTLESPLDCEDIKAVNPKGNQLWIFIGRTNDKSETLLLCHLMWRTDSFENALMLGKIEGRRRRGWQRIRWLDSYSIQWIWIWANSGRWWRTGKPGML